MARKEGKEGKTQAQVPAANHGGTDQQSRPVELLWPPLVMLSSTITELAELRLAVDDLVKEDGLASAWLFEEHAVASGSPPSEQYLAMAAASDLYVLIVADQHSPATEAEYEAAFADNPEKVLPFFAGDGSAETAQFRSRVEQNHTRVTKGHQSQLAAVIALAIREAVLSGMAIRRKLVELLDDRIERARTAVADVPILLEPRLVLDRAVQPASSIIKPGQRVAVGGVGGSGKTVALLVSARRTVVDHRTLPVYATASDAVTDPEEIIRQRLESVRFRASTDLLDRWGSEGRILLIVDATENMTPAGRRRLFLGMARWAERYPRCGAVVCSRRFAEGELDDWLHVAASRLDESQLQQLANSLGVAGLPPDVPEQLRDIATQPMWATAIMVYGSEVSTGLELLQRLMDTRLTTAGMSSAVEREELRAAAGFLAFGLWPASSAPASAALDQLSRWHDGRFGSTEPGRFAPDDVLQRLGESGLIEVGDSVEFAHRLLATLLAAEHVVGGRALNAAPLHDELAPFVAALADDDQHVSLLHDVLSRQDIFVLASYLRLSPRRIRVVDTNDVDRLRATFRHIFRDEQDLDVFVGEPWFAARSALTGSITRGNDGAYRHWRNTSSGDVEIWPVAPFDQRSPEFVSAVFALGVFRERVLALNPGGDVHSLPPPDGLTALFRDKRRVEAVVIEAARARQRLEREFLDSLGLHDSRLVAPPEGAPKITIWHRNPEDSYATLAWGAEDATVVWVTSNPGLLHGATMLVAHLVNGEDRAAAYAQVANKLAGALGARLGAKSWSKPVLTPALNW